MGMLSVVFKIFVLHMDTISYEVLSSLGNLLQRVETSFASRISKIPITFSN